MIGKSLLTAFTLCVMSALQQQMVHALSMLKAPTSPGFHNTLTSSRLIFPCQPRSKCTNLRLDTGGERLNARLGKVYDAGLEYETELMAARISDSHIRAFARDGIVPLRKVIGKEWIDLMKEGTRNGRAEDCVESLSLFAKKGPLRSVSCRLLNSAKSLLVSSWLYSDFECDRDFQRPEIGTEEVIKTTVAFFVPLDSVSEDESIKVLRGSHLWSEDSFPKGHQISADVSQQLSIGADLEPGDCVAFHGRSVMNKHVREGSGGVLVAYAADTADSSCNLEEVWEDKLYGMRGETPTTVVQWSKGIAPPNKDWYT